MRADEVTESLVSLYNHFRYRHRKVPKAALKPSRKTLVVSRWTKLRMKKISTYIFILTVIVTSCGQKMEFPTGTWIFNNLNTVDSSVIRETLLKTFIVSNYNVQNHLTFKDKNKIVLQTEMGRELGTGEYVINDTSVTINFPGDNIKSVYKIKFKSDSLLKLTAFDDDETVNISLTKYADN